METSVIKLILLAVCGAAAACGSTDIMGTPRGDAATDAPADPDVTVDTVPDVVVDADHWIMRIGDGAHSAHDVLVLGDGSLLVTGHQSGAFGGAACWLGRISAGGEMLGQWTVSDLACSSYFRSSPTEDGGAVVVASAWGIGDHETWVGRLNADLTLRWQQFLDMDGDQRYSGIEALSDGSIVVVTVDDASGGLDDLIVVKLAGDGEVLWARKVGTVQAEEFAGHTLAEGPDGRIYIAAGSDNHDLGYVDVLVVAMGSSGNLLWNRLIGERYHDGAADMLVDDAGIVVVGQTDAADLDECASWALRMSHEGEVLWQSAFNGGGCDHAAWIVANPLGGFTIGGGFYAVADDVMDYQMWLATLDDRGNPGAPLLVGNEWFTSAASATALGPDVVVVGHEEWMTGALHLEMIVARAGLDASFGGDCPLVDRSHALVTGDIDATSTVAEVFDEHHEVRAVATTRNLQEASLVWAVDCP
jgi:hypothetical protein